MIVDAILYINLAHRQDKDELICHEIKNFGADFKQVHRIEGHHDELNGHRGCAISHIKALDFALSKSFKNVLILEDDACLNCKKTIHDLKELDTHFDVYLLGGKIYDYDKTSHPHTFRVLKAHCAHAYVVNRHYIQTLKGNFEKTLALLNTHLFMTQSRDYGIDTGWWTLMKQDQWLFSEILFQQRATFSDIDHCFKDRTFFDFKKN